MEIGQIFKFMENFCSCIRRVSNRITTWSFELKPEILFDYHVLCMDKTIRKSSIPKFD